MIAFIRARLREPSTYGGIAAALTPFIPYCSTLAYFAAAMGVLAVVMKDPAPQQPK